MEKTEQGLKFTRLKDHFNLAATAVAAYIPFLLIQIAIRPPAEVAEQMAIIGGVFTALRLKYLREIPLLPARLLMNLLIGGKREASPQVKTLTEEFCEKAGHKVKPFTYDQGATKNALSFGGEIYIGKGLEDQLTRRQLGFVIAHEIAHAKTQDISEQYLFWPPFFTALLGFISTAMSAASTFPPQALPLAATGVAFAHYLYQKGLDKYHSRQNEYRADRNALLLTGDLDACVSSLMKIEEMNRKPGNIKSKNRIFSSHPSLEQRIGNLNAEAVKFGLMP